MANEFIARKGIIALADSTISGSLSVTGTLTGDGSGLTGVIAVQSPGGSNGQIQYNDGGSTGGASSFYYNDVDGRVGIGTSTPANRLHVYGGRLVIDNVANAQSAIQINSAGGEKIVIYRPSNSDDLRIYTPGAGDAFTLSQAGAVGINDTNPGGFSSLNAKLVVGGNQVINNNSPLLYLRNNSSGNDSDFRFSSALRFTNGAGTEFVKFAYDGKVGIGTTTPAAKLEVDGTFNASEILLSSTVNRTFSSGTGDTHGQVYINPVRGNRTLSITTEQIAQGEDIDGAAIDAFYTNTGAGNDILFRNGGSNTMILKANNRVGIGTISPAQALDVVGNIKLSGYLVDSQNEIIEFATNDLKVQGKHINAEFGIWARSYGATRQMGIDGGASYMGLYTSGTEKVRIDTGGNVGIGRTSPGAKLDVGGTIRSLNASADPKLNLSDNNDSNWDVGLEYVSNSFYIRQNAGAFGQTALYVDGSTGATGIGTTTPTAKLQVQSDTADSTVFAVDGVNGRLFSIDDSLSDSLFSVNTIAGLPVIEAFADNTVVMGAYGTNNLYVSGSKVGINTDSPDEILHIHNPAATAGQSFAAFTNTNSGLTQEFLVGINQYEEGLIWNENNKSLIFATNNGERMRILNTGNVGIGTSSPTDKLHIHDSTSGDTPRIHFTNSGTGTGGSDGAYVGLGNGDDLVLLNYESGGHTDFYTAGNNRMRIDNTGNVGIGTTSPADKLTIYADLQPILSLRDNGVNSAYGGYLKGYGLAGSGGQMGIGVIDANIYREGIHISEQLTSIVFKTSSSETERMRITNSGNVGIGTNTPRASLDVNGDIIQQWGNNRFIGLQYADGADYRNGLLLHGDNRATGIISEGASPGSNPYLWFGVGEGGATERMRINKDGNVGIATNTPGARLHVNGSAETLYLEGASSYTTLKLRYGGAHKGEIVWYDSGSALYMQNLTGGPIMFYQDGNERLRINTGGNVGIGTSAPSSKLHIVTGTPTGAAAPSSDVPLLIDSSGNQFIEFRTTSAASGLMQGTLYSDNGKNAFIGYKEYTGAVAGTYGESIHIAVRDFSASDAGNGIYLGSTSNPSLGVTTPHMFIKGSGNVGIGTTAPSAPLSISNGGAEGIELNYNVGNEARILSYNRSNSTYRNLVLDSAYHRFKIFGNEVGSINGSGNVTFNNDLTVGGTITAQEFRAEFITNTIILESGSTQFGDSADDTHTFTGTLSATSTGTAGAPVIDIVNTSSATFNHSMEVMTPNMTAGENNIIVIGRASSTKNSGYIGYKYSSAGANANVLTFGHWGSDNLMNLTGDGKVGIGTQSPTQLLDVAGNTRSTNFYVDNAIYHNGDTDTYIWFTDNRIRIDVGGVNKFDSNNTYLTTTGKAADSELLDGLNSTSFLRSDTDDTFSGDLLVAATTNTNATTKIEMRDNAVFGIKPNSQNSGTLHFAQVDSGNSIGMQFTNGAGTADWDISMQPFGGRVGIGTVSPDYMFTVAGSNGNFGVGSTGNDLYFTRDSANYFYATGGSSSFRFFTAGVEKLNLGNTNSYFPNGNVGIGTTNPAYKLDVAGTIRATSTIYANADINSNGGNILRFTVGTNAASGFTVYNAAENGYLSNRITTDAHSRGWGWELTNSTANSASVTAYHRFGYGSSAPSWLANGTGNVGIGVTSPTSKLHVDGQIMISSTSISPSLKFQDVGTTNAYIDLSNGNQRFDFRNDSTTTMSLRLDTGNVGIGTTNPGAKLDVAGQASIDSDLFVGADGGANYTASRLRLYSHDNYRGAGMHMTGVDSNWFIGTPYTDFAGSFIIARKGVATSEEDTAQLSNALFTVRSTGRVGIGTTSPTKQLHVYTNDNEGIFLQGSGGGVWMNIQASGGEVHSIGAQTSGMGVYNRTQSLYRMFIDNAGNVGIGTTSTAYKLDVVGTIRGRERLTLNSASYRQHLAIERSGQGYYLTQSGNTALVEATGATDRFDIFGSLQVKSNGNVGIGTTAPDSKLTIRDTSNVYVDIQGDGNVEAGIRMRYQNNSSAGSKIFYNTPNAVLYYDNLYTYSVGKVWGSHSFRNKDAAGTLQDRLYIAPLGNVGIGTTSPNSKLEVYGSGGTVLDIQGSQGQLFSVSDSLTGSLMSVNDISGLPILEVFDTDKVVMGEYGTNALVVTGSNVGIGTDTPIAPLSILATSTGYSSDSQIKISDGSTAYYGGLSFDDTGSTRLSVRNSYDGTNSTIGFGFGGSSDKVQIINGTGLIVNEGNVGIGTTSPGSKLHVEGEIRADFNGTDGSTYMTGYGIEFERGTNYLRPRGADGTQTLHIGGADDSLDWNNVNIKTLSFTVRANGADRFQVGSDVAVVGSTDFNITGTSRRLNFTSGTGTVRTTSNNALYLATNNANRLTITGGGAVGIGTTSPNFLLDVAGDAAISGGNRLWLKAGSSIGVENAAGTDSIYIANTGTTGSTLDIGTGTMVIVEGGNVGIGTTSPAYKLHVEGEAYFSDGNLRSNNSFDFLTTGGSAQKARLGGIQVSTSYSGTTPDNAVLFYTDNQLQRTAADQLTYSTTGGTGYFLPGANPGYFLGADSRRWEIIFCNILDSAGLHEKNLENPEGEKSVGDYATGTVLVWKGGKNVPCSVEADHMRMGIAVEGMASPLVQGAEPVLCTGVINEGDYIITSDKEGHARGISRQEMLDQNLFDCVLGKALEQGEGESYLLKVWVTI